MERTSTAVWNGSGKEGKGTVSTPSNVLNKAEYSYSTRFENEAGTNPEELVAAAHAGCFSMKLAFVLQAAGLTADEINTACTITLDNGTITESHLVVKAKVPGTTKEKFLEYANDARANCPISKLLNANITMEAELQ
jgi:osmotically inducible protein OsmC